MSNSVWQPADYANVRRWAANPHLFVREAIGATPHPWQDEELRGLPGRDRIAIAGSKGCAKTTLWAWIIWWHLFCFPFSRAAAVSGSKAQLRDTLWAELSKWQSPLLKRCFAWSTQRIVVRGDDELQGKWWASARTINKDADEHTQGQALAGVHGHPGLIVLDECGAMPPSILPTADAILATKKSGDQILVAIGGNTTSTLGALYAAATKLRALWHYRKVTSDPKDPNRTPNVTVKYAQDLIDTYGIDNPFVKINVFAEFPPTELGKLLSLADLEQAMARQTEENPREPLILGVDVGTVNDAAVIYPRRGRVLFPAIVMRGQSTVAIAAKVVDLARTLGARATFVDMGGPGVGVVDQCRALGLPVVGVFFSSSADDGIRFADKRMEMYERAATWVKEGGCITAGDGTTELVADMLEPDVGWHLKGYKVLEPKDEVKKRLNRSTDWGDGFALTFAYPVAPAPDLDLDPRQLGRRGAHVWRPPTNKPHDEFGFGGWRVVA